MADYYDLISPRKGKDDKTRWHRVGAAFADKNGGDAFNLVFDSLPLPDAEGRVALRMSRPLPKDGDGGGYQQRQPPRDTARQAPPQAQVGGSGRYDVGDDEIPF
jgi:hypothetical protein